MRVALISDVHSNLPALESVLADIDAQQSSSLSTSAIDKIICLGDLVDLGPQPREVLAVVRSRSIPCVRGNHDPLSDSVLFPGAPPLLRTVLERNRRDLDEEDRRWLEGLPESISWRLSDDDDGDEGGNSSDGRDGDGRRPRLLCVHGSPRSDDEGLTAGLTDAELDEILLPFGKDGEEEGGTKTDFDVLACGHTHLQMVRRWRGKTILNVGSVGCPFERAPNRGEPPKVCPWAEYAIVECRRGGAPTEPMTTVELRRVPYDLGALRAACVEAFGEEDGRMWMRNYEDASSSGSGEEKAAKGTM